jgi:hypothetical protein
VSEGHYSLPRSCAKKYLFHFLNFSFISTTFINIKCQYHCSIYSPLQLNSVVNGIQFSATHKSFQLRTTSNPFLQLNRSRLNTSHVSSKPTRACVSRGRGRLRVKRGGSEDHHWTQAVDISNVKVLATSTILTNYLSDGMMVDRLRGTFNHGLMSEDRLCARRR